MAEAHPAILFTKFLKPDGGFKTIASTTANCLKRRYAQKLHRIQNKFYNRLYPAQPGSWPQIAMFIFIFSALGFDLSLGLISRIEDYLMTWIDMDPTRCHVLAALVFSLFLWIFGVLLKKYTLMILYSYTQWIYEVHSGYSLTTKIWAVFVKICKGRHPRLYSYQTALPKLPLPSLNDTIERYLQSMEPLLNKDQMLHTDSLASSFLQNEGPKLQRYLWLKRFWSCNYVSDWWEDYVYLHGRSPLVGNSNVYALDSIIRHPVKLQAARAAHLLCSLRHNMLQMMNESLEPTMVNNLVPLCMIQYERIFGTTRIPGVESDKLEHYARLPRHCVVLHRGRYFKFPLSLGTHWLDEREMERMLQSILDDVSEPVPGERNLAALTAGDRIHWAIARGQYFSHGPNADSLTVIDKAAFFLCLEDEIYIEDFHSTCDEVDRYAKSMLCGDGTNRWFDKSLSFMVSRNCIIGLNMEHAWADAPVMGHLLELLLTSPINYDHEGHCMGKKQSPLPTCRRLKWDFPEKCIEAIQTSLGVARDLISDIDLHVVIFREFGKCFISSKRLSPDAFFQMALQVSYFREMGNFCLTYEASMTRLFREGRTETVRSCTNASVAFVKAMENKNCTKHDRLTKLKEAVQYHQVLYRDAMTGKGVDRHLFCLYVVSRHLQIDSPFLQDALAQPWRLSTSQTPHGQTAQVRNLSGYEDFVSVGGGFGPVSDDGYGVSYILPAENMAFVHISSKHSCSSTDSKRFGATLVRVLTEMRQLFD